MLRIDKSKEVGRRLIVAKAGVGVVGGNDK